MDRAERTSYNGPCFSAVMQGRAFHENSPTYVVTVLLDVNDIQDIDDRAESRSYLVADRACGQAVLIDSVLENVERDVQLIEKLGLTLAFVVETHIHADHITGASLMKDKTGAQILYGGGAKGVVTGADRFLSDGETLWLGKTSLMALARKSCLTNA